MAIDNKLKAVYDKVALAIGTTNEFVTALPDCYDAVEAKGGTIPAQKTAANLPNAISSIPAATPVHEEKEINFIDHTGTIVASYTLAEALLLTELPTPIQYDGLTFVEWQFTLAEVKTFAQHNTFLNVGAYYKATDELTHLFVNIRDNNTVLEIYLYGAAWNSSETIDWGDGSSQESIGRGTISHTYSAGSYEIVISSDLTKSNGIYTMYVPWVKDKSDYCLYKGYISPCCTEFGGNSYVFREVVIPSTTIQKILFPFLPNTIISNNSPNNGGSGFNSTKYICSRGIDTAVNYAYEGNLAARILPPIWEGATGIGGRSYRSCYSVERVVFPSTITTINNGVFLGNYRLRDLFIYSTQVPTLSSAGSITDCNSEDLTIHVLSSLYSSYENDTNWAAVAAASKITLVGDL